MAEVITTDSSPVSCPDCEGHLQKSAFTSEDGETGSRVLVCVDCDFKGVASWDFIQLERME